MVAIIDKNPRKPRKEGPIAQKRYVDELQSEWFDHHASKDPEPEGPPVPENLQRRYEAAEEITRQMMEDKGMFDEPGTLVIDTGELRNTSDTPMLSHARRAEYLWKVIAQEYRMYGRARDETLAEYAEHDKWLRDHGALDG